MQYVPDLLTHPLPLDHSLGHRHARAEVAVGRAGEAADLEGARLLRGELLERPLRLELVLGLGLGLGFGFGLLTLTLNPNAHANANLAVW